MFKGEENMLDAAVSANGHQVTVQLLLREQFLVSHFHEGCKPREVKASCVNLVKNCGFFELGLLNFVGLAELSPELEATLNHPHVKNRLILHRKVESLLKLDLFAFLITDPVHQVDEKYPLRVASLHFFENAQAFGPAVLEVFEGGEGSLEVVAVYLVLDEGLLDFAQFLALSDQLPFGDYPVHQESLEQIL